MALGSTQGVGPGTLLAFGPDGSIFEIVALAGSLVLVLIFVALAGVAYKGLTGDGIEWPDEEERDDDVRRGDSEDEWKYY